MSAESIDQIQKNKIQEQAPFWLSKPLQDRWSRLRHYEYLLTNNHEAVYLKGLSKDDLSIYVRYLVVNFARAISKVSADFLIGDGIKITPSDDITDNDKELLNIIKNENREYSGRRPLNNLCHQTAFTSSAYGISYWKIYAENEDEVGRISYLSPFNVYPVAAVNNADVITKYVVELKFIENGKSFLLREHHYLGQNIYELFEVKDDNKGNYSLTSVIPVNSTLATSGLSEDGIENLQKPIFDIIAVPNIIARPDEIEGESDYVEIADLQGELNRRVSQLSGVFDKHGNPKMAVPAGVLDDRGQLRRSNAEVFEVAGLSSDTFVPSYITYDSHTQEAITWIDKITELLYFLSEISPSAAGENREGNPESAAALRYRLMRTISKIQRKRRFMEPAIKMAIDNCFLIVGKEAPEYNIEFADPMPISTTERAQEDALLVEKGIMSQEQAVRRRMGDADEQTIQDELSRLKAEQQVITPPPTINLPV